jgi:hypothetical protein
VRGVGRAAPDAKNKKATAAGAYVDKLRYAFFAIRRIDFGDDFSRFFQMLDGVGHGGGSKIEESGKDEIWKRESEQVRR